MQISPQDIIRFYSKVRIENGCWEWQAAISDTGYGIFSIKTKLYGAHRISSIIRYGQIPKGMYVLHKCDNRACVRGDHLFLGSHKDNMDDMLRKGRSAKGTTSGQSKLTEADIPVIRQRLASGETPCSIAKDYPVHESTLYAIKDGTTWKHIP